MKLESSIALLLLSGAFVGLLAGCPGTDDGGGTDTDAGTGTTGQGATTDEPTTTEGDTPGETGDASTGDASTGDASTGDADAACACIAPDNFGNSSFTCESGACGPLNPECVAGEGEECELSIDEAQLECALDLLIAGESGVVTWAYSPDGGFSEDGGFVQLFAGRQALTRTWFIEDSYWESTAAGVVALKAASYFQACKQELTSSAKFWCLVAWSDQTPPATCDDPFVQ